MNSKRYKARFIDFCSLRFPCGTFSDLDGYMEFPCAYILLECKCGDGINCGQLSRLARMAEDMAAGGKQALVIVAHYADTNPDNDVDIGTDGMVGEVFAKGMWYRYKLQHRKPLREFIDAHYEKLTGENSHETKATD
jgi:hypothetical protein